MCATAHEPELPHNQQSLFYGMRFRMEHGRDSTWADACAHCTPTMRANWKRELNEIGRWTQPKGKAKPIAEPCNKVSPAVVPNMIPIP
jgi:hypothetical protein